MRAKNIIRIEIRALEDEGCALLSWMSSQQFPLNIEQTGDYVFDVFPPDAAVAEDGGLFWCMHNTEILDHMGLNAVKAPPMPEMCEHCTKPKADGEKCLVCREYEATPRMRSNGV